MQLQVDKDKVKEMARRLREALAPVPVSHGRALELVSRTLGYPNWDTLSGLLARKAPQKSGDGAPPRLDAPVVVYMEAYADSEWDEAPTWARLTLTAERLHSLWNARRVCIRERLDSVEVSSVWPDAWDREDKLRIVGDACVVTRDWFWFTAHLKHADVRCETRYIAFDELARLLAHGNRDAAPYFAWCDGMLFRDGNSAKSFVTRLVEEEALTLDEACIDQMP